MIEYKISIDDDGKVYLNKEHTSDNNLIDDRDVDKFLTPLMEDLQRFIIRREEYGDTWKLGEFQKYEALLTAMVCFVKCRRLCHILDKEGKISEKYINVLNNNNIDLRVYSNFLQQHIKIARGNIDETL